MERYSFEKAQEEAAQMHEKVASGEAETYEEAESLVEVEIKEESKIRSIYRGIWADRLQDGEDLPVGGNTVFDAEKLTAKCKLDFKSFNEKLEDFTKEHVDNLYERNKEGLLEWLEEVGSDVDPYLYYVVAQVQWKMQKLLGVDKNDPLNTGTEGIQRNVDRVDTYADSKTPKLSELKGKTMCAERAALGQYLLQKIGIVSSYVSGITMRNAENVDEYPDNHSFIVLNGQSNNEETYIFDISRPRSQQNMPRLLKTDVPMNYELLQGKNDLLIGANEVLQGGRLYFGVGSAAQEHNIVGKEIEKDPVGAKED